MTPAYEVVVDPARLAAHEPDPQRRHQHGVRPTISASPAASRTSRTARRRSTCAAISRISTRCAISRSSRSGSAAFGASRTRPARSRELSGRAFGAARSRQPVDAPATRWCASATWPPSRRLRAAAAVRANQRPARAVPAGAKVVRRAAKSTPRTTCFARCRRSSGSSRKSTFNVINVQSKFTEQQIEIVMRTLMEAILLTGLAMIFFLRSWRSAIVVCVSIPTSLAIADHRDEADASDARHDLAAWDVAGHRNPRRRLDRRPREHRAPFYRAQAAAGGGGDRGREEIGAAAVVITLVDVVVFLPIAFIQGQVGRQIAEFAIVVVISTLTSLFVSFTVTPTLAGLWALRSHWKPWRVVDWFGDKFDDARTWYTRRACCRGASTTAGSWRSSAPARSCWRSRWSRSASSARSSFRPSTAARSYIQLMYPIGTPLQTVETGMFTLERKLIDKPDVVREHGRRGRVRRVVRRIRDPEQRRTDSRLAQGRPQTFDQLLGRRSSKQDRAAKRCRAACRRSSFRRPGRAAVTRSPIDFLVTDLTGGDPTPYAQKVARPAAARSRGDERQQHRHPARAGDLDPVRPQQGAGARRRSRPGGAGGRRGIRRQRRDAVRDAAGLEQVQVIYPRVVPDELDALKSVADPVADRRHRLPRRHRALRLDADVAADHAHRSQQRRSRQRELRAGLVAVGRRERSAEAPAVAASAAEHRRASRRRSASKISCIRRWSAWGSSMIVSVILVYLLDGRALQQLRLAVHHHLLGAGRGHRRDRRALPDAPDAEPLLADRHHSADRHRDEERHPVGRLRQHAAQPRARQAVGDQARARTRDSARSS